MYVLSADLMRQWIGLYAHNGITRVTTRSLNRPIDSSTMMRRRAVHLAAPARLVETLCCNSRPAIGFVPVRVVIRLQKSTISVESSASRQQQETSSSNKDPVQAKNLDQQHEHQQQQRHQTTLERLFSFKGAAKRLWGECLQYRNIEDASRTRRNAWTTQQHLNLNLKQNNNNEIIRSGRVPRRQREQQRLLKEELRTVLPTLVVWAVIPLFGWTPVLLAVVFPRVLLSRQFHTNYEIEAYASIQYKQRSGYYAGLGEHFWNSIMIRPSSLPMIPTRGHDEAGPILMDVMQFYNVFAADDDCKSSSTKRNSSSTIKSNSSSMLSLQQQQEQQFPKGILSSLDSYPRKYLVALALSSGVNQSFPKELARILTVLSPSWWLQMSIHRLAAEVTHDDELLLEENADKNRCESLTDREAMDACLLRGLPINVPSFQMRNCLTNHLDMIRSIKQTLSLEQKVVDGNEGFRLFSLQLSALRQHFQKEETIRCLFVTSV